MSDLDFYCWRVPTSDEDGNPRLLVPWADPQLYEWPFDFMFNNEEEAQIALDEWDAREDAQEEQWVLIHYRGTQVVTLI